ncbi:FAD-linked oxidoreductase [Lachnellula subtilissima]|uniref:FAD-linked oxidoreductase n=1 Tax=Lachnellula subtilissima TaxID=602034 RepID=A0A8H8U6H3_9HELO|nr:FAD-linked oxidoreductase [Lachnellula subtilissima]
METSLDSTQSVAIDSGLGPLLSKNASIVHLSSAAPRWSDFAAPAPGTVVNVFTEKDVAETVKYCIANNITFLAQSGAHGWATTFRIGQQDVTINLRGLNTVTFDQCNEASPTITLGGGSIISEVIAVADANGAHVPTGNCNCVGALGAILGGGVGHLMGLYGLGVDNLVTLNLVNAEGELLTINPAQHPDLWWALRGAGPNFGIVTSATIKAYPRADRSVWTGSLIFTPDKIEQIVSTINDLPLLAPMSIFLYFATSGAPNYTPTVVVAPFYAGPTSDAETAFASILALGPVVNAMQRYPYTQANFANDPLCGKGGRKPSYGSGLSQMDPATWRSIWNEYVSYVANPAVGNSSVFAECYSFETAKQFPDSSSSYPFRSTIKYTTLVNNWYTDASLDPVAEAFGIKIRELWRSTDGLKENSTYINFAFGDEPLETVYGDNVGKLQDLKRKYDPRGRFNQWFPLT